MYRIILSNRTLQYLEWTEHGRQLLFTSSLHLIWDTERWTTHDLLEDWEVGQLLGGN